MIVLDTHVWIWWVNNHSRLKPNVRELIDRSDDVRICSISLLEIATAVANKRLELTQDVNDWLAAAQSPRQIQIEPL